MQKKKQFRLNEEVSHEFRQLNKTESKRSPPMFIEMPQSVKFFYTKKF